MITTSQEADKRRWITLAVLLAAISVVIVDNTVLTVAVPTLLREFDTTLPALQWVLSGYALTFATVLIIGGKLADLYGPRRIFIIGLAIFGIGSLIASLSRGVVELVIGEAIIEGIGASLMLPASTGIMTTTFRGRERVTAYAAWGSVVGAMASFGPVIGGYLTTYHSWRWAFRINVILAPLAIVAALVLMARDEPRGRPRFDLAGAAMVAIGSFFLVFAVSQGPTYGWWKPTSDLNVKGSVLWPATSAVSIIPMMFLVAAVVIVAFIAFEWRREAAGREVLFPLSQLEHAGFRYGLLTAFVFTLGAFAFMFLVPVFLQASKGLPALEAGLWLVPYGLSSLLGAQVGGRFARRLGPARVTRLGLLITAVGYAVLAVVVAPTVSFAVLGPAMIMCGFGGGFATAQLSSIVLVDVDPRHASVAAATASTIRQLGSGFGIAAVGAILTSTTLRAAAAAIDAAPLSASGRAQAIAAIEAGGLGTASDPQATPAVVRIMTEAIADGVHPAFLFTAATMVLAAAVSLLLPHDAGVPRDDVHAGELLDTVAAEVP